MSYFSVPADGDEDAYDTDGLEAQYDASGEHDRRTPLDRTIDRIGMGMCP
jgi:hypothetical protein